MYFSKIDLRDASILWISQGKLNGGQYLESIRYYALPYPFLLFAGYDFDPYYAMLLGAMDLHPTPLLGCFENSPSLFTFTNITSQINVEVFALDSFARSMSLSTFDYTSDFIDYTSNFTENTTCVANLPPTNAPSDVTTNPTNSPTLSPFNNPTNSPLNNPSNSPLNMPSLSPLNNPSASPTHNPIDEPSTFPSSQPSTTPTNNPTNSPITPQRTLEMVIAIADISEGEVLSFELQETLANAVEVAWVEALDLTELQVEVLSFSPANEDGQVQLQVAIANIGEELPIDDKETFENIKIILNIEIGEGVVDLIKIKEESEGDDKNSKNKNKEASNLGLIIGGSIGYLLILIAVGYAMYKAGEKYARKVISKEPFAGVVSSSFNAVRPLETHVEMHHPTNSTAKGASEAKKDEELYEDMPAASKGATQSTPFEKTTDGSDSEPSTAGPTYNPTTQE